MCGECCRRYSIPVNSEDIRRISDFTGLTSSKFLELIVPDESVASTYHGVPRMNLAGVRDNILVLKEENDACMFLKDKRCAIYQARPLRCRPFPLSYETERGQVVFSVNEDVANFCKGLGREGNGVDLKELGKIALAMEKEQKTFRERIRIWNSKAARAGESNYSIDDVLKFLLPYNKHIQEKSPRLSTQ